MLPAKIRPALKPALLKQYPAVPDLLVLPGFSPPPYFLCILLFPCTPVFLILIQLPSHLPAKGPLNPPAHNSPSGSPDKDRKLIPHTPYSCGQCALRSSEARDSAFRKNPRCLLEYNKNRPETAPVPHKYIPAPKGSHLPLKNTVPSQLMHREAGSKDNLSLPGSWPGSPVNGSEAAWM